MIGMKARTAPLIVCTAQGRTALANEFPGSHHLVLGSRPLEGGPGANRSHTVWTERIFNDISAPVDGLTMPSRDDIAAILEAGRRAAREARPLVINCFAAVSRSTAAAYMIACDRAGPGNEMALAREMRGLSPEATPNPAMIALADHVLLRGGLMREAISAIGRGVDCSEGRQFIWHPALCGQMPFIGNE